MQGASPYVRTDSEFTLLVITSLHQNHPFSIVTSRFFHHGIYINYHLPTLATIKQDIDIANDMLSTQ
jgi:hypothetical protein